MSLFCFYIILICLLFLMIHKVFIKLFFHRTDVSLDEVSFSFRRVTSTLSDRTRGWIRGAADTQGAEGGEGMERV